MKYKWDRMNDHSSRFMVNDRYFIDREDSKQERNERMNTYKYGLYEKETDQYPDIVPVQYSNNIRQLLHYANVLINSGSSAHLWGKTVVFENDMFRLVENGQDYDFVAFIDNKTDHMIELYMDDEEAAENCIENHMIIPASDWIGLVNMQYEHGCNLMIAIQEQYMKARKINSEFDCPHCGKNFKARSIDNDELGWHVSCPECTGSFDVDLQEVL